MITIEDYIDKDHPVPHNDFLKSWIYTEWKEVEIDA